MPGTIRLLAARREGVHLCGGKVARGGLRWSDCVKHLCTEVLPGLAGGPAGEERGDRELSGAPRAACPSCLLLGEAATRSRLRRSPATDLHRPARYQIDNPGRRRSGAAGQRATTRTILTCGRCGTRVQHLPPTSPTASLPEAWLRLRRRLRFGGSAGYDHAGMGLLAAPGSACATAFPARCASTQKDNINIGIGDMGLATVAWQR